MFRELLGLRGPTKENRTFKRLSDKEKCGSRSVALHNRPSGQLFYYFGCKTIVHTAAAVLTAASYNDNQTKVSCANWQGPRLTTLGGGSLGSCVDEERSQLRELM